jgi:hypothetical protein
MSTIDIIRSNYDQIVERSRQQAGQSASARGLTAAEFENIIPHFLSALVDAPDDSIYPVLLTSATLADRPSFYFFPASSACATGGLAAEFPETFCVVLAVASL